MSEIILIIFAIVFISLIFNKLDRNNNKPIECKFHNWEINVERKLQCIKCLKIFSKD